MNCLLKGGRGGQVYQDVASSYTVCVSVPCCPRAVGGNVLEGEILYALAFPPSWSVCRSPEAEAAVVSSSPKHQGLPRSTQQEMLLSYNATSHFPPIFPLSPASTDILDSGGGHYTTYTSDIRPRGNSTMPPQTGSAGRRVVCLDRGQGSRYVANLNHGELEINEPLQFVKVECAGVYLGCRSFVESHKKAALLSATRDRRKRRRCALSYPSSMSLQSSY